jgi:hypothetical protein
MSDLVIGIIVLAIGALVAMWGYPAFRVMISLYGAFIGFVVGASLGAGLSDTGFAAGVASWVGGIVGALLVGGLSYAFYWVAVIFGVASLGFSLGTWLGGMFGVGGPWPFVIGVGVAILAIILALALNLPSLLIIGLTATAGAGAVVSGVMLISNTITTSQLAEGDVRIDGLWLATYVAVVIAGVFAQWRYLSRTSGPARGQWQSAPQPSR